MKLIENAGFKEMKIIEETHLPLEMVLSDSTAKAIIKELKLTMKSAAEIAGSVASIKVSAMKTKT